ncbi:MAG: tetratricopeptide repeat protein [Steroidobacteraceae bacterium]|jgi:protein O-GlcNAc transferase
MSKPQPTIQVLLEAAMALYRAGRFGEAQQAYEDVLRQRPANFDATHMLGIMAMRAGDAPRAVAMLSRAVRLNPKHAQAYANLGTAYSCINRPEEALHAYDHALKLDRRFTGVLHNRGTVLQRLGRYEEAAESFARLWESAPATDFALGSFFENRRYACDWRDFERHAAGILAGVDAGRNIDRPFSFLSVSGSAAHQHINAKLYTAHLCPSIGPALWRGERYDHPKIRVAYVSADFRDHVVMRLVAPILELHDRQRFYTIGVSLVPDDGSDILRRATRALDQFVNVSRLTDDAAAGTIRELEVDIAVDLTGYTDGCRPRIFARRPAPVSVNLFGFPGTMGAPFIDYLIADEFVAPESNRAFFSERVVRLPDTFQVNGQRSNVLTEPPTPSRAEAGLPEQGLVLCAFNNTYKLNPQCFDIWARIMQAVAGSVLWLLGEGAGQQRRLRDEAVSRGVRAERLVFAKRIPYGEHLVRLRLADLFLDTLPFNAGATAGDVLWAGVPLLTCAGEAFASRMAGSVLRAVGMPELITDSPAEYEARAIELARDADQLAALRARLAANRHTHPLFDMNRYCKYLEAAYVAMWERSQRGEPPEGINVPAG